MNAYARRIPGFIVATCGAVLAMRGLHFLYHSLHWPLSICLDAVILRFESWSMLDGVWPWRDIVSINLPVTHYIHILGLWLFGTDDFAFRLMDASYILLIALMTAAYLSRVSLLAAGLGAALVLCLPHEATPYGAFQREVLMLPLWLATLWWTEEVYARFQATDDPSTLKSHWTDPALPRTYILPGVLAVITIAIKPTSALLFLFFALALLAVAIRAGRLAWLIRGTAVALLALAITIALVFAPLYVSDPGLPRAFLEGWLQQTRAYAAVTETIAPLKLLGTLVTLNPSHWTLALNQPLHGPADTGHLTLLHLCVFGLWFIYALRKGRPWLLVLFALAALLQYLLQMRGFQYHLYPLWYAFALAAAVAISDALNNRHEGARRWIVIAAGVVLALSLVAQQNASLRTYRGTGLYDPGHPERVPRFKVAERLETMAGRIRAGRGEGYDPGLYLQTFEHATIALGAAIPGNLKLASRYPVDYIVWEESPFRAAAREDMLKDLREHRPELVAYAAGHDPGQKARLETWPELGAWLEASYVRREVIQEFNGDEYWIYVRVDLAPDL